MCGNRCYAGIDASAVSSSCGGGDSSSSISGSSCRNTLSKHRVSKKPHVVWATRREEKVPGGASSGQGTKHGNIAPRSEDMETMYDRSSDLLALCPRCSFG